MLKHKFLRAIAVKFCVVAAWPSMADPLRLVAFGDSLIQGYGLEQGQGLVPQMQDLLQSEGYDVQVMNAGVSGDTTAGGAARIDWTLADNPDAMVVLLGGNDLLRGLPPQETRANLMNILSKAQAAQADVLLVGMQAPMNYGADYKADFDAVYPDLAAQFDVILHPYAFAGMAEATAGDMTAAQAYMQSDGIHPNAEGVALNLAAMQGSLRKLMEQATQSE